MSSPKPITSPPPPSVKSSTQATSPSSMSSSKDSRNLANGGAPKSRSIDLIDPDDPEYIKNMQRPADVKEDMVDMDARKRVSAILNSRAFRHDLEQIILEQIRDGIVNPSSLLALQHLSEMLIGGGGGATKGATMHVPSIGSTPQSALGRILPINDIRNIDAINMSKTERNLRCKLASLYRLVDIMKWSQGIYNHISVRISQDQEHFLINPFGLLYSEVSASSLVKINMQGDIIDHGSTTLGISKAGFIIHSAIHGARPDVKCVIHCHTPFVAAVSTQKFGLLPLSQESLICGPVSYHDYQGLVTTNEEKEKLVRNLGPKNKIMILRNHGIVACGSSIEEAFHFAFHIILACETQIKALSSGLDTLTLVDPETARVSFEQANRPDLGVDSLASERGVAGGDEERTGPTIVSTYKWKLGEILFEGYMRYLDSMGYRTGYPYKNPQIYHEKPRKAYDEIEIPPSAWSSSADYDDKVHKIADYKKKFEKCHWLNSPNAYTRIEVTETGTSDPKKITKWVPCENGTQTIIKEDKDQFIPVGTNKKEFKKLHQEIKDNRRGDKLDGGPKSTILDGITWDEANKPVDGKNAIGEQIIIMGAASKGIIDRSHQHNRQVYHQEYHKNPFDHVDYGQVEDYKHEVLGERGSHSGRDSQSTHRSQPSGGGAGYWRTDNLTAGEKEQLRLGAVLTNQNGSGDVAMNGGGVMYSEEDDARYYYSNPPPRQNLIREERETTDLSTTIRSTDDSVEDGSNNTGTLKQTPPDSPTKDGSGSNGSKKKKGFRTPSFLKRKKSKEQQVLSKSAELSSTQTNSSTPSSGHNTMNNALTAKDTAV